MPSFAVGMLYSPTGNSLEGMKTAEFSATVGEYSSSFLLYSHFFVFPILVACIC